MLPGRLISTVRRQRVECAARCHVIELYPLRSGATLDEGYDWRNYVEDACGAGLPPEWTL